MATRDDAGQCDYSGGHVRVEGQDLAGCDGWGGRERGGLLLVLANARAQRSLEQSNSAAERHPERAKSRHGEHREVDPEAGADSIKVLLGSRVCIFNNMVLQVVRAGVEEEPFLLRGLQSAGGILEAAVLHGGLFSGELGSVH